MEKFNGYIIDEKDVAKPSGIFSSKRTIELRAKVIPDAGLLYEYMRSLNIVNRSWERIVEDIQYGKTSYWSNQERTIVSAISEFISSNERYITGIANIYFDFSLNFRNGVCEDHPITYDRAMKQIKEKVQQLPNPQMAFLSFLKSRGLSIR